MIRTTNTSPEFDLFISYVRRDVRVILDGTVVDVVAQLKTGLERHRRPAAVAGTNRTFRVCTDIDDFALDGTFDLVMRDRISRSRALLLVCTLGVTTSRYVQRELQIHAEVESCDGPVAAVLSASPSAVAPDYFHGDEVAADLAPASGITHKQWKSAIARESHKIVARVWGLPLREVFDRFEADRRSVRRRIVVATTSVAVAIVALVIGLAADVGFHRVATLPLSDKLVAPAGVAFADADHTPVVVSSKTALLWSHGIDRLPESRELPFFALHALGAGPDELAIAGLRDVARLALPSLAVVQRWHDERQLAGITASTSHLAVSTKNGALALIGRDGSATVGPRPASTTGRRFPAFREKGRFRYGDTLALGSDRYIASATPDGHLAVLDRTRNAFIEAPMPQFPLSPPIDTVIDPVLYETENTRPIGAIVFLPDGDLMFGEGAGLRRVDVVSGQITMLQHCSIELVRQLVPLPDGRRIIALTSSTLELLRFASDDPKRLDCLQRTTLAPKSSPRAALSPDGSTLLVAFFDGEPELWRRTFRLFGIDFPLP